MVRLRQVATGAGSEVGAIGQEVSRLSISLGVSSQSLIKTAVTLKQANLSIGETKDALEALARSALAPNFDSIEQTVEGAIAVMNQFKIKSKDLESALGSMNAVAGEFAVEASDLIEVVRRAGGAFAATGGNLNELLGLFTSVRQTTRESAESIATGLRTIFTRIQRNDTVESLKQIGVNLRYTRDEAKRSGDLGLEDQFVGAYEAVRRLSVALTKLPQADPRYSAIVENLGGYRQISKVIPLIQEFAVSERALMVAEAGRVSLTVNASQAADSYSNKLTKLKESYLDFGRSLMDSQGFKATFSAFEEIANGILSITNALRPLMPLLTAFAAMRIGSSIGSFVSNFSRGASYTGTGNLLHRASGGLVPGSGDTDSVPMGLRPGSFVVKKSSVKKAGVSNLISLANGSVPTMLTPGEYVFSPEETKKIGLGRLKNLNRSGAVAGFNDGGMVEDSGIFLRSRIESMVKAKGYNLSAEELNKLLVNVEKTLPDMKMIGQIRDMARSATDPTMILGGMRDVGSQMKKLNNEGVKQLAQTLGMEIVGKTGSGLRTSLLGKLNPTSTQGRVKNLMSMGLAGTDFDANEEFSGLLAEAQDSMKSGSGAAYQSLKELRAEIVKEYESRQKKKFPPAFQIGEKYEDIDSLGIDDIVTDLTRPGRIGAGFSTQDIWNLLKKGVGPKPSLSNELLEKYNEIKDRYEGASSFDPLEASINKYLVPFGEEGKSVSDYVAMTGKDVKKPTKAMLAKEQAQINKEKRQEEKREKDRQERIRKQEAKVAREEARAEAKRIKREEQEAIKQQIRDEKEAEVSAGVISDKPNRGILGDTLGKTPTPVAARRRQFAEVMSLEQKTKMLESNLAQKSGDADINNMGPIGFRRLAEKLKNQSILSQEQYDEIADIVSTPGFDGKPPAALVAAMKAKEQAITEQNKKTRSTKRKLKESEASDSVSTPDVGATQRFIDSLPINQPESTSSNLTTDEVATGKSPRKKSTKKAKSEVVETQAIASTEKQAIAADKLAESSTNLAVAQDEVAQSTRRLPRRQGEMFDVAEGILPDNLTILPVDVSDVVRETRNNQSRQELTSVGSGPTNIQSTIPDDLRVLPADLDEAVLLMRNQQSRRSLSTSGSGTINLPEEVRNIDDILPDLEKVLLMGIAAGGGGLGGGGAGGGGGGAGGGGGGAGGPGGGGPGGGGPGGPGGGGPGGPGGPGGGGPGGGGPGNPGGGGLGGPGGGGNGLNLFFPQRSYGANFDAFQGTPDRFFNRILGASRTDNQMGAVNRTVASIDTSDLPRFLSEMSRTQGTSNVLAKSILQTLDRTRPDLGTNDRMDFAQDLATNIFNRANSIVSLQETANEADFRQTQAQQRAVDIRQLPGLIEQANLLRDRSRVDPAFHGEYVRVLDRINETAQRIGTAEGINPYNLVGMQNGQMLMSTAHQQNLEQSARENELMATNAAEQARRAREEAARLSAGFDGIGASISRDASGRESVRFSGSADAYGAGVVGVGGMPDDTLGRVLEKRIEARLREIDPRGLGVGDNARQIVEQEENARLHAEYVNGRKHQIAAERRLTDMTIAAAAASEEYAQGLENGTRVVESQSATGNKVYNLAGSQRGVGGDARRGSYEDLISRRIERELQRINPTNAQLPQQTIDRVKNSVIEKTNDELLRSLNTHVRLEHGINDRLAAQEMAHEKLNKIIRENASVRERNNRAIAAETSNLGYDKLSSKLSALGNVAGEKIGSLFSSQTGFFALQAGASFLGDFVSSRAGTADMAAESQSEGQFLAARSAGSMLQGGGMGASLMMGANAGPIGIAVGAAAGALMMFTDSINQAANEISQAKIALAQKQANDALSNFAKGVSNLNPELIRKNQDTIDQEMSKVAMRKSSTFGFGLMYSGETFNNELDKQRRESAAASVPAQMDALTKIIEEQAKGTLGALNLGDEATRLNAFRDSLYKMNQGIGGTLLGKVAAGTQQDFGLLEKKLFESFKRIQDNEQARQTQLKSESSVNSSAALFGNFGSAISVATQRLQNMSVSTKNLTDIMDGTISISPSLNMAEALQKPFASDGGEFMDAVKSITTMAGASGGEVEKSAAAISAAGRALPDIINTVRSQSSFSLASGTNFGIQVSDLLRQTLQAQNLDPAQVGSITQLIQGQLGEEDFTKILRETGQDMGKLIQKLLGPIADPLKQSFTDIAKNLNDRSRIFADGLSELATRIRTSGELIDKANSAEMASIRNAVENGVKRRRISEDTADFGLIQAGANLRRTSLSRLTGFGGAGSENPRFIASILGGVLDEIKNAEQRSSAAAKSGNIPEQNSAAIQLASLKTRAADLGQALKNLTDVSERTSQAQEKLAKIQADREGRQALGIRYATANTEGRAEIASSFRLIEAAARMGTAANFSVKQQNQIFSTLSSLSPQMRLAGLGGISVKDLTSQLLTNTFGGAFDLDPQTAAIERALDGFVQNNYDIATEAARMQAEIQQKLQADFFSNLQNNQKAFLDSMADVMEQNARNALATQQLMAANRVQELEKNIGGASIIGRIGIKTDDQFTALKGSLKNPEMSKLMEAGNRVVEGEKSVRRITEGSDRFAANLAAKIGDTKVSNTVGSAAGIIKSQLEELGVVNQEDKNNILIAMDRFLQANNARGTFGSNQDQVKKALIDSTRFVLGERIRTANSDVNTARDNLINSTQGKIPENIFRNLANEIQKNPETFNITSLEKSIAAVEGMNTSFTKMNETLEEARLKLSEFTKAIGENDKNRQPKALGGPIRFFNKGGWGHQGSATPHSSDTVNARINPNEFVVSAGPAQRNKKLLENINAGYADGGVVVDSSAEDAKKNARIQAELNFLMRLKEMKPEDRTKLIEREADQIKALAGKENEEQLSFKNIIDKFMSIEKNKGELGRNADLESFHVARRKIGISEGLRNFPGKIETGVPLIRAAAQKYMDDGKAAFVASNLINKSFQDKAGVSLLNLLERDPDLNKHAYLADQQAMGTRLNRGNKLSLFEDFKKKREEFRTFGVDLRSHIDTLGGFGTSTIGFLFGDEGITVPAIMRQEQEFLTKKVLEKYYPNGIFDKVYSDSMSDLSDTSPANFSNDIKNWTLKFRNNKYEEAISDLLKKSEGEIKKMQEVQNNRTKNFRMGALQTAEEGIAKIFSERNDMQFNQKQDADLMKFQLMAMEANAFNRLNPAVQTKLLEIKRRNILENKVTPAEKAQMAAMGLDKLINSTDEMGEEEINKYSSSRSKMTLIQRAALDVLVGKIAAQSKDKFKEDPDSLTPAEKTAYLMAIDAEGRSAALDDFGNRQNAMLFNRIGMWITTNPGAINGMLDKSKDKGPFGYARDAALLEILASAYGAPTTLPKASEVFKDRTLKNKQQIEAGEQAKAALAEIKENFDAGVKQFVDPNVAQGIGEAFQFGKKILGFATGGLVPGVGNTDSVRANLPVGSYVVRKSSVQKIGAENLAAMPHLAKGGFVPAMVMPGEHIFTPDEVSKIGISRLDAINKYGDGSPGGVKPNRKAVWNGEEYDVVHENGRAILIPKNGQKWSGARNNQLGFQPQNLSTANNPLANNNANQVNEQQFMAIEAINQMIGGNGGITGAKAKYFSLRDELRDPRNRSKEKIAEFRQLYAMLTNPLVAQMDAQRQMLGAQDAFASFQQDPKAFITKSKELRALAANAKATMEERVAAKEQLNQMNYAARFIDPRALKAAAVGAQKQQQQKAADNDPMQGGLFRLDPALAAQKMAPDPNGVAAHNARVRANAEGQAAPDRKAAEANHLKKMLEIAQENYLKTGDPKFLQEINKLKNPEKVQAEEKAAAQRAMEDYRAKKQKEAEENKIAQWHVREGIEDIKDPGGVKRGAEKLQKFYAEKDKKRQEFEARVFAHAPTYEENMPKMQKEWDEKNKGAYDARIAQLQKESEERLNRNPLYRAIDRQLAQSPYVGQNQIVKKASGGIVPGYGSGDHVPALLEPGEAVIPRRTVQKFANGGIVGGIQGFANGGMAQGGPELLDVAAKFNQAATQISQGLSGFSTSVSTFNGAVANFGTFVDKFDEAVGKIPGQIELSGANEISVNLMGQDSIVKAVTEAIGPMIAEAIRANQPVEQRSQ
jgi:hypothetical protein